MQSSYEYYMDVVNIAIKTEQGQFEGFMIAIFGICMNWNEI